MKHLTGERRQERLTLDGFSAGTHSPSKEPLDRYIRRFSQYVIPPEASKRMSLTVSNRAEWVPGSPLLCL